MKISFIPPFPSRWFLFFAISSLSISNAFAQKNISTDIQKATEVFLQGLSAEQKSVANLPFDSEWRFDWHFTPRQRKGLPLKQMDASQRQAAMQILKTTLSDKGLAKVEAIIGLEQVLRQVENRPENDTYRDPENYAFLVFGTPDSKLPWGWRVEGHHLSLHFTIINGKIQFLPSFFGSNPGVVLPGYVQEGKQVLKEETESAFRLLASFDEQQLAQVIIADKAPYEIITSNSRKVNLQTREGLSFGKMTSSQQAVFKELLNVYFNRFHVTLKNQALHRISQANLNDVYFAWMGEQRPERGQGKGYYYRIHGPTFLIEYDNTQNNANHVHSVIRDLTDDWGEDLLKAHYEAAHKK